MALAACSRPVENLDAASSALVPDQTLPASVWIYSTTEGAPPNSSHYEGRQDRRGLWELTHTWSPSQPGDSGQIQTHVTLPGPGPYYFSFYASDNFNGSCPYVTDAVIDNDVRVGHRFRRVLFDDTIDIPAEQ